jgi:hypothetical protein
LVLAVCVAARLSTAVTSQSTATRTNSLAETWQLARLERATAPQSLSLVANPVGMLIQDAGGHVIEIVSSAGRPASLDAAEQWPHRHVARLPPVTGLNLTFYWRSHVHCTEH